MKVEIICVALLGILSAALAEPSSPCTEEEVCNDDQKKPFSVGDTCFLVTYSDNTSAYVNFESECKKAVDACNKGSKTEYNLSLQEMCDDSSWNAKNPTDDAQIEAIVEEFKK